MVRYRYYKQEQLQSEEWTSLHPYKLDKTKLEYEPQYVDKDSDSFSENIKVSKNEADVKYSGNYQDQLQFTMNPIETRTIQLDCNGGTVNGKR